MLRACRSAYSTVRFTGRNNGHSELAPRCRISTTSVQWRSQAGDAACSMTTATAHRKGIARRISLWMLFPRHRFGTSLFNTPLLLVLRLFYQAASFDVTLPPLGSGHEQPSPAQRLSSDTSLTSKPPSIPERIETRDNDISDLFAGPYEKIPTTDWYNMLAASPSTYEHCRIVSITWVKALASPLSHEFVQFIVEDASTGLRSRIIADRQETGDWVFVGWDWASNKDISDRHSLPLPLLSLTYDNPSSRPDLVSFAKVLADVTKRHPYRVMREMCWWYAETVLEMAHINYGGRLEQWKYAKLRYSLVVWTNILRREALASQAEEFRKRNSVDMSY